MNTRMIWAVILGGLVFFGGIFTLMSLETIKQGHVGVVYNRNGGVEDQTLSQGMHFISPLKKVTEYPVALETVEYEKIQLATKDGKPLTIDMNFNYMNDPERVVDIFNRFKGAKPQDIENSFLLARAKENALAVTSKYTILEIFQKREEIRTEISTLFTEDLKEYGFIVSDFVLGTPIPDESTERAIQRVVDSQQELEALKIETQKAVEEAERKKVEAQGVADALLITSKAEAEANEIINASLTDDLVQLKYIEKWNGIEPSTKVTGSDAGILIGK